ncbi:formylglycine-generating enzyme family protein [Marilutibacter chinensis]|uniref:Formylglycine-generating enzyme family protein n=1 Tax=Marilutibacter chinensis TaxID=2912247 RepID=A0ABS9HRG1_9GAMM|nr:formylglycine-generating enzyme family protein [Lysobacter chinensis]MCF7220863.1 formylglycine-generating enzyme family protein [Lysobacter chinensis]
MTSAAAGGRAAAARSRWCGALAGVVALLVSIAVVLAGCSREPAQQGVEAQAPEAKEQAGPSVTVSDDQALGPVPDWQTPTVSVTDENVEALQAGADEALQAGNLYEDSESAIPIYLALKAHAGEDAEAAREADEGLQRAIAALIEQGDAALAGIDTAPEGLQRAQQVVAVARAVAADAEPVVAYLERVESMERVQQASRAGERALEAGRIDDGKDAAVAHFRHALELREGDARALQGLAASESALIRRAEQAAEAYDYERAEAELARAAKVRPGNDTVAHARQRIAAKRASRIGDLRDLGIAALSREDGLDTAREHLAELLRIAPKGDPAAAELRERIELATHYGLFRPGQVFTDALKNGGRGPQMVVIPHGAFTMGAADDEEGASDSERPTRNIRFDRGLAVARTEVTVAEFRRYVEATGNEPRAVRRGYSTVYDERSGNLVRRGGAGPEDGYTGRPADDDMPVVHVSAADAAAYASWLSEQTGHTYRLPSEAEFEYALRAGSQGRFPWGDGAPPAGAGNFTGGLDTSPSGRRWRNAFEGYGDGAWGPAEVGSYAANAYGLHDMAGNVSEWVADCWHDNYRRAPRDGHAWVNPGCREKVVRGGSWASSPEQTRSAWRLSVRGDTTNARVGFRVVREI